MVKPFAKETHPQATFRDLKCLKYVTDKLKETVILSIACVS